jgi:hypothetical protein
MELWDELQNLLPLKRQAYLSAFGTGPSSPRGGASAQMSGGNFVLDSPRRKAVATAVKPPVATIPPAGKSVLNPSRGSLLLTSAASKHGSGAVLAELSSAGGRTLGFRQPERWYAGCIWEHAPSGILFEQWRAIVAACLSCSGHAMARATIVPSHPPLCLIWS